MQHGPADQLARCHRGLLSHARAIRGTAHGLGGRYRRWTNAHQPWSLDRKDSDRGEPEGAEDLADGRFYGRAALGYAVDPGGLYLEGVLDLGLRRRTLGDLDRRAEEQRFGLQLSLLR